jgi:acyl-CoA synthetase (AMP-forming)/AMP-acid ligase II
MNFTTYIMNCINCLTHTLISQATVLYMVPPLVQFLGTHPKVMSRHFETVRFVASGAGPIGQSDAQRVLDKASHIHFIQGKVYIS